VTGSGIPGRLRGRTGTLLGAALVIGLITLFSRLAGFARWLVFARTVGSGCLGDAYTTANQLPNVVFELVAGGMLAATMVPLVAGAARRGDTAALQATAGALLGWVLVLLLPAVVVAAAVSGWYAAAMMQRHPGCGTETVALTKTFLIFFAPQIVLYGLAVWASSLLAAYHRFVAAAVAPLVSTVIVIASYGVFAGVAGRAADRAPGDLSARIPGSGLVVLAGGTTLGVVVLALTVLIPVRGTLRSAGVAVRPTLRFPAGLGPVARRLALAGVAGLASQQLAMLAFTWIANREGESGTVTLFSWTFAVFSVPFAVLLAPIATSAFPRLAAAVGDASNRDPAASTGGPTAAVGLRRLVDTGLRTSLLAAGAGAALLVGTSAPVAAMFTRPTPAASRAALAAALVAIAPGLLGYGVLTLCSRILAAQRRSSMIAATNAAGWLSAVVVAVVLAARSRPDRVVVALAAGLSAGLVLGGIVALIAASVGRRSIGVAMAGLVRPLVVGVLGAAAGGMVGWWVSARVASGLPGSTSGLVGPTAAALGTAVVVVAVYAVVIGLGDRADARRVLAVLRPATADRTDEPTDERGDTA
jgi:putative peptidoglycan lipid II flippase